MSHTEWRSRGYLPHFDQPGLIQGVTFRLWDSLPAHVVADLMEDTETMSDPEKRERLESYLNAGYGQCYLAKPAIALLVENALLHFDAERYRLIAWVVMPNHVHALVELFEGHPLDKILHSWKSFTASKANDILKRQGPFWFREYYDRYIRNELHFARAVEYIHNNPVVAGLVEKAEDWPFSSVRYYADRTAAIPGGTEAGRDAGGPLGEN